MLTESQKAMITNLVGYRWRVEFLDTEPSGARIIGTVKDEDWVALLKQFTESGFKMTSWFRDESTTPPGLVFQVEDTVPTKPVKPTPFAIGQRWRCDRDGKPTFFFVVIGPGHLPNYKMCRLEADDPRMYRYHGEAQEYSHKHLKKCAVLVKVKA